MERKSATGIRLISIILLAICLLAMASAIDAPVKCTCNCRGNTIQAVGNTNSQCSYSCGAVCGGSTRIASGDSCDDDCEVDYCGDSSVMDCSSTPDSSTCESACESSCERACENNTSTYSVISTLQYILLAIAAAILALCGLRFITSDEAKQRDEAKKCIIFVIMILILIGIAKPLVYSFYTLGGITGPGPEFECAARVSCNQQCGGTGYSDNAGVTCYSDSSCTTQCPECVTTASCDERCGATGYSFDGGIHCYSDNSCDFKCPDCVETASCDPVCGATGYSYDNGTTCYSDTSCNNKCEWACPTTAGPQKDVPCAVWDWPLFDVLDCNNDVIQACDDDLKVWIDGNIFDDTDIRTKVLDENKYDGAVDEIFSELKAFYLAPDAGCSGCEGGKRLCEGGILCDDKKSSDLLSGAEECGNCADWSTTILSLLRTIGVPKERAYVVSFQVPQGSHAVAVYESDGGEWRVLDLLNLPSVKSVDSWRYIPGFCKCTQYYTNDYSSTKFDDKSMFNNFCTDDSGEIGGVPAASATQLCDPTPDSCDPSGDPVGAVALSFSAEDVVVT